MTNYDEKEERQAKITDNDNPLNRPMRFRHVVGAVFFVVGGQQFIANLWTGNFFTVLGTTALMAIGCWVALRRWEPSYLFGTKEVEPI